MVIIKKTITDHLAKLQPLISSNGFNGSNIRRTKFVEPNFQMLTACKRFLTRNRQTGIFQETSWQEDEVSESPLDQQNIGLVEHYADHNLQASFILLFWHSLCERKVRTTKFLFSLMNFLLHGLRPTMQVYMQSTYHLQGTCIELHQKNLLRMHRACFLAVKIFVGTANQLLIYYTNRPSLAHH